MTMPAAAVGGERNRAAPTPLAVLTGFLGAGKTTLVNRILAADHGLRIAVLVNDFGAINLDAELVAGAQGGVLSLANGCVCCTIRDDLVATVMQAIARPERPEYVVLEASGVADPVGIAMTCNASELREHVRLDAIHCVVDAEQLFGAPETMELKLAQMACADMILLNKVDLVRREQIARIRSWLDGRFHRYRLVETVRGDVPMPILLSPRMAGADDDRGAREAPSDRRRGHRHDAAAQFATWQYETDQPLSLTALRQAASRLPPAIYRAKGVVSAADTRQRCVLHVVGRRVDVALDGGWRDETPRTRIVAIGAPGAIDAATLRDLFDRCLASRPDRLSGRGAM